ncbi:MAG: DUF1684 domain-containing protein [Ignavibacteriaceae bacterium]|nr:DUF1684 domain-containing protein [Ignavibacteriaceae bacterium]
MKKIIFSLAAFISIIFLYSCKTEYYETKGSPEYLGEIKQWDQRRLERLKADDGWLNLVGRTWLKPGENKFGSAKDNEVLIESEKVPAYMGVFVFQDSTVTMKVNDGVDILYNGNPVKEMVMISDGNKDMTVFQYGSIKWNLIVRNELYGIRFRDLESEFVKSFSGIERFPVNEDWRIEAKYEVYDPPKKMSVPNVLGQVDEEPSPGAIVFTKDNQTYRLNAIDAGDKLWFIIADGTSGGETYGGGRFLYTDKADSNGIVIIDFNKAYDPPCVLTKFATCPLPPKENYLTLRITAGEKMWGEHH